MAGRPRIGTRHNIIIPDADWSAWCRLAESEGITISQWLRKAGQQQAVKAEPPIARVRKSKGSRRRPGDFERSLD